MLAACMCGVTVYQGTKHPIRTVRNVGQTAVVTVFFLLCTFVLRDHQSRIKRRCSSVLLVFGVSPDVIKTWMHVNDVRVSTQDLLQILVYFFS